MAKKITAFVKLAIPGGGATPAPPVGPALGQHGVPIMDFVTAFNERTKDQKGTIIPAVITIYEDRTFDFVLKKPPASELLKKRAGVSKGSGTTGKDSVASLSQSAIQAIAEEKMPDLNANSLEAAKKTISGTARSMGIKITD